MPEEFIRTMPISHMCATRSLATHSLTTHSNLGAPLTLKIRHQMPRTIPRSARYSRNMSTHEKNRCKDRATAEAAFKKVFSAFQSAKKPANSVLWCHAVTKRRKILWNRSWTRDHKNYANPDCFRMVTGWIFLNVSGKPLIHCSIKCRGSCNSWEIETTSREISAEADN